MNSKLIDAHSRIADDVLSTRVPHETHSKPWEASIMMRSLLLAALVAVFQNAYAEESYDGPTLLTDIPGIVNDGKKAYAL